MKYRVWCVWLYGGCALSACTVMMSIMGERSLTWCQRMLQEALQVWGMTEGILGIETDEHCRPRRSSDDIPGMSSMGHACTRISRHDIRVLGALFEYQPKSTWYVDIEQKSCHSLKAVCGTLGTHDDARAIIVALARMTQALESADVGHHVDSGLIGGPDQVVGLYRGMLNLACRCWPEESSDHLGQPDARQSS